MATPITAEMTVSSRKKASSLRYGVANDATLRNVPFANFLSSTELSWRIERQALAPDIPPGRVMGNLLNQANMAGLARLPQAGHVVVDFAQSGC